MFYASEEKAGIPVTGTGSGGKGSVSKVGGGGGGGDSPEASEASGAGPLAARVLFRERTAFLLPRAAQSEGTDRRSCRAAGSRPQEGEC